MITEDAKSTLPIGYNWVCHRGFFQRTESILANDRYYEYVFCNSFSASKLLRRSHLSTAMSTVVENALSTRNAVIKYHLRASPLFVVFFIIARRIWLWRGYKRMWRWRASLQLPYFCLMAMGDVNLAFVRLALTVQHQNKSHPEKHFVLGQSEFVQKLGCHSEYLESTRPHYHFLIHYL